MFPREFKNWKYKMQVGRAVLRSVCAISGRQTVVQQNGVEVLHQN